MISRNAHRSSAALVILVLALALPACASDNDVVLADVARDAKAASDAKALLVASADDLRDAATKLCAAAPQPAPDGWNPKRDAANIAAMKKAWKDAHGAYASIEAAVVMLFPSRAAALDARYEEALAAGPEVDPFNRNGFVGLHAIERILWADRIPPAVQDFESNLVGYKAASFPIDATQAGRFRAGLCRRLVADATELGDALRALTIDSSVAYEGAVRLVRGQLQKVVDAGEGHEESRYAGHSLADMSANVASAKATYTVFESWLLTKQSGAQLDQQVKDGFARLEKEYAAFGSDALPYVPMGWSVADLTSGALETPFGQLFTTVSFESNEMLNGSLARSMAAAAEALGVTADVAAAGTSAPGGT